MDRTARGILSIAIAILFPTFIYFAVVTFLPAVDTESMTRTTKPSDPRCAQSQYDYTSRTYRNNEDCIRKHDEYNEAYRRYSKELQDNRIEVNRINNERTKQRSQIALILALVGMFSLLFALSVKELAIGLSAGAALTVLVAVTSLLSDYTASDKLDPLSNTLVLFAFAALTGLVYFLDRLLPEDKPKALESTPAASPEIPEKSA